MIEVPVLVVGSGPVGLMTALELQSRGIRCLVVERNPATTRHPKMDVTNSRSMEHFRRLGIAEHIRDHAVPRSHPMDVSWVTRLGEWEVARFAYANVDEQRRAMAQRNDGTQPLEPNMRMSQVVLEPVLTQALADSPLVDVRFGHAFESLEQDESGVTATIRGPDGEVVKVRAALLAGCDGGGSRVREALGITCQGQWNIVPFYMVHYRTPARDLMQRFGIAWHYQSVVGGTLIAQNDEDVYTLHTILPASMDPASVDPKELLFQALGLRFQCEVLQANAWSPHLVVADSYGRGRVWLAGDSVHQYIPTGGYGMNTGICDAVDLAWKFAAVLQGWGGPELLATIDAERRPIGERNRDAAGANMGVRFAIADAYTPLVHEDTPEGAKARAEWGQHILDLRNDENESFGIELDYRYRNSPIICAEDHEPPWHKLSYYPSTWPGVRAPHVFLENGDAIFDRFGRWFTLVRFDPSMDVSAFVEAARARKVPLDILDIAEEKVRNIYGSDLVLIRPDQHVAWRGDAAPSDPGKIIDRVIGAAS